jgi:hypothetical protein
LSAEILRVHPDEPQPDRIDYIVSCLRKGDVVALPTDTFYGLAVDPVNLYAVEQIYRIKSRQKHKPLSLLISGLAQAYTLARDTDPMLAGAADDYCAGGDEAASAIDGEYGERGAAGAGCGDSEGSGGAVRAADYGDVGEFAGGAGVYARGMRARPDRGPDTVDYRRRTDGARAANDDRGSLIGPWALGDTARGCDTDARDCDGVAAIAVDSCKLSVFSLPG